MNCVMLTAFKAQHD